MAITCHIFECNVLRKKCPLQITFHYFENVIHYDYITITITITPGLLCRRGIQTGVRISFEYLKAFRLPNTTTHCIFIIFATFKITPRMIKMLYLHILEADSTENWNAFCKLIFFDSYKISKKSKKSVL